MAKTKSDWVRDALIGIVVIVFGWTWNDYTERLNNSIEGIQSNQLKSIEILSDFVNHIDAFKDHKILDKESNKELNRQIDKIKRDIHTTQLKIANLENDIKRLSTKVGKLKKFD